MRSTLDHYNRHGAAYALANHTRQTPQRQARAFLTRLQQRQALDNPTALRILDAGCGTGRDSLVFLAGGAQVDAFDGAETMVAIASQQLGLPVRTMRFEALDLPESTYDGIWAMASLLHVAPADLPAVLVALGRSLKPGGRLFASFKHGQGQRTDTQTGRVFTDMDYGRLAGLLRSITGLALIQYTLLPADADQHVAFPWFSFVLERSASSSVSLTPLPMPH